MTQQMTKAEIVEETKQRILAQGGYGLDRASGFCAYRAPDGNRCAVGVWLKGKHVHDVQGLGVERLPGRLLSALPYPDIGFWISMQSLHDDCAQSAAPLTTFAARMDALKAEVSS